ncbi:MAG: benzoate/H(+) symporter BenE family transporter [Chloroflexi bacterium]|nr:benzoate/H(+) symporter BenE family transporter [Chloroflexota bacterium]MCC6893975.1 benzoate/H(+) symporter BenE family transporter [Anaerolineae bacterium]
MTSVLQNIRDLPRALTPSAILSGLLVVVVGYASSLVLVFQAATNANMDNAHLSSWVIAITLGSGFASIVMSLWFRQPAIAAWSTPGIALLFSSLGSFPYSEIIGAYIIASVAIILLGFSGLFGRLIKLVPQPVVMGMLAGVLIRFGFGLFTSFPESPLMVLVMLVVFFLMRRMGFRAPTIGALAVGLLIAALNGEIHLDGIQLNLASPLWTTPTFSVEALLSLALPLFTLALTSQNAPGQAVLRAAGYEVPINKMLGVTGFASLIGAPFGGHGITLSAITAAMVTGPETHPDPDKRYAAGVATGFWFIVTGVFGATVATLFAGLPIALIHAISGLALAAAIMSSLSAAMAEPSGREGALVAFMCTAPNFTFLNIGAPFWGLVFGVLTHLLMTYGKNATDKK